MIDFDLLNTTFEYVTLEFFLLSYTVMNEFRTWFIESIVSTQINGCACY
jgi:hypothetical protein